MSEESISTAPVAEESAASEIGTGGTAPAPNEQTSAPASPFPKGDWREGLPPDLHRVAERYPTPEALCRAYREAASTIGKKIENFSKEDFEKSAGIIGELNGIPTSPDDYSFDLSQAEGQSNTLAENDIKALQQISHKMGLNNEQAQALYTLVNGINNHWESTREEYNRQYIDNNMSALEGAWGKSVESELRSVENAVENILPGVVGVSAEEIKKELRETGGQYNALLMKTLAAIGKLGNERSYHGYANLSPTDARIRLEHMKSDPEIRRALSNTRSNIHANVREEYRKLAAIAYGENMQ